MNKGKKSIENASPMMTSSKETCSTLLAIFAGTSQVTAEFSTRRPVTRSFDLFFGLWINGWINNGEAGDMRRERANHDVTVISVMRYDTKTVYCTNPMAAWHIEELFTTTKH